LTYHEQLSISIDIVSTRLSGVNIVVYDLIAYTLIGIGVVGLLKIVGYILEHVLILIPSSIATIVSKSAREALILSILLALNSSLIGLHLSILLNLPPSGLIGFVLLVIYLASMVSRK
ncbi:MAG: metal ABC transporter permease, partial [Desulfurococcaceae archaeon]